MAKKKVEISNVYQTTINDERIDISFMLNDQPYVLMVAKSNGLYFPALIDAKTSCFCSFCQKHHDENDSCWSLIGSRNELFQRLIQFPSIRLEWLFLPYNGGM